MIKTNLDSKDGDDLRRRLVCRVHILDSTDQGPPWIIWKTSVTKKERFYVCFVLYLIV